MKKNFLINQKGVTIIALIVTIVVLLILAGITIGTLTNNNGIIEKSKEARATAKVVDEKKSISTVFLYSMQNYGEIEIGEQLYDKESANGNIIVINESGEIYGENWIYIPKNTNIRDYGKTQYSWLVNNKTTEMIQLEEGEYTKESYRYGETVTDESYFSIEEETGIITDFSNNSYTGGVVIPETIKGIKVTGIGSDVFNRCTKITRIVLPDGITSIADGAFQYCSLLKNVNIPYGVTTIGESAFRDCLVLESIDIPDTVTSIGDHAFRENRALVEIIVPDSVITIGTWAFAGCTSLEKVTIGTGVTSIGNSTFSYDTALKTVTIKAGSTLVVPSNRWGASKGVTITKE